MPGLGHRSWLQFAKESVYGTAVAATQRLELIKWNVSQQIGVIRDPSLYAAQTMRGLYQGGQLVKGTFTVRCGYEGLEEIARGCMGTYVNTQQAAPVINVANSTLTATGNITLGSAQTAIYLGAIVTDTTTPSNVPAGTYVTDIIDSTHVQVNGPLTGAAAQALVFTNVSMDGLYTDGATLNSYTVEASEGDVTTGTCARVVGAVFTGFTVKGVSGTGNDAMLTIDVTILGKDMTKGATPSRFQSVGGCTIGSTNAVTGFSAPTDPILVGQTVTGTGIPNGVTVVTVVSTTSLILSDPCTNGSGLTLQFSLSYPAVLPVLYHQAYTMLEGSGDAAASVRWRSFDVSVTAPHTEDRFYLGSVNIDQPLRSDFVTTKWKSVQEFTTLSQFNAAKNFAPSGGHKLIFRSPNAIHAVAVASSSISTTTMTLGVSTALTPGSVVTGTGVTAGTVVVSGSGTSYVISPSQSVASTTLTITAYRELELRSNSVRFTSYSNPVENYGIILATAEAEAFRDTTDNSGLAIRIRNALPALT